MKKASFFVNLSQSVSLYVLKMKISLDRKLFQQMYRYGIIGAAASLTQFLVVIMLVANRIMEPLNANVAGYACGFIVSFYGQRYWTFIHSNRLLREALPMLLGVSGVNFAINQGCYYIFLRLLHLEYYIALLLAMLIAAIVTFTLSKLIVFQA